MFIHVEFLNAEQSRQSLFQIQLPDKTDVQHFVQRLIHYLEPVPLLLLLPLVFSIHRLAY